MTDVTPSINHIDSLTITKLSTTHYLIQNIKSHLSISTLQDHLSFPFSLNYALWSNVLGEKSSHSTVIFKMQKMVIGIIMAYGYREFCREFFK
jgi:hypothetical protein